MITKIATLDTILNAHSEFLGRDFTAYRNHTYRIVNLCAVQISGQQLPIEKLAIAAAFHDMGIWTDGTFDYLAPSVRLAATYLEDDGKADWIEDITDIILNHHKIRRYPDQRDGLVEVFRKADWADVSLGIVRHGIPKFAIREAHAVWPSEGFHKKLIQLELARLRTHPWNPLPMLKL